MKDASLYRSEIDGLRGIAVLAVVLYHAQVPGLSGGFAGVDVFFVISGYLITAIIHREMKSGQFTLSRFYERRIRRILPALFVVCLLCLPFAWAWMLPADFKDFGRSLVATQLFVSNILFWREQSYFGGSAELKPLLHTWSLSVEEQFYIGWPLVLFVLMRLSRPFQWTIIALIFMLSLWLAIWGAKNAPVAAFYLTPTRCYELLAGAILALKFSNWSRSIGQGLAQLGGMLGLTLVVGSLLLLDEAVPFPSYYALPPVLGTALLILCARSGTLCHQLLIFPPLVGIGLVSYSLYLWHQPVFAFTRIHFADGIPPKLKIILVVCSLLLAYLTWRFVEQPARAGHRFTSNGVFAAAFAGSLILISAGSLAVLTKGFPERHSNPDLVATLEARLAPNVGLEGHCEPGQANHGSCRVVSRPEIAVWGDSFAMHVVPALLTKYDSAQIVQFTAPSCGPISGVAPSIPPTYTEKWASGCQKQNEAVLRALVASPDVKTVFVSSSLSQYFDAGYYEGQDLHPPNPDVIAERLLATLDTLARGNKRPIFVEPPPLNGKNIGLCLARAIWFETPMTACDFSESESHRHQSKVWDIVSKVRLRYPVVSFRDLICSDGVCHASMNGVLMFRDDAHLSVEGARFLGERLTHAGKWQPPEAVSAGPNEL